MFGSPADLFGSSASTSNDNNREKQPQTDIKFSFPPAAPTNGFGFATPVNNSIVPSTSAPTGIGFSSTLLATNSVNGFGFSNPSIANTTTTSGFGFANNTPFNATATTTVPSGFGFAFLAPVPPASNNEFGFAQSTSQISPSTTTGPVGFGFPPPAPVSNASAGSSTTGFGFSLPPSGSTGLDAFNATVNTNFKATTSSSGTAPSFNFSFPSKPVVTNETATTSISTANAPGMNDSWSHHTKKGKAKETINDKKMKEKYKPARTVESVVAVHQFIDAANYIADTRKSYADAAEKFKQDKYKTQDNIFSSVEQKEKDRLVVQTIPSLDVSLIKHSISSDLRHLIKQYLCAPLIDKSTIEVAVERYCDMPEQAKLRYGLISNWDTSHITDMSLLFQRRKTFNENIEDWDVSNVINMQSMFFDATSFNQPLNRWDVRNVVNMGCMFYGNEHFNQPLSNWQVGNVTDMCAMFEKATVFNQSLEDWDVSNVTDMSSMFKEAKEYNQPMNKWNVSKVTTMTWMFSSAKAFNQPLDNWDVSNVVAMQLMFSSTKSFNQSLNDWNVSKVTDMNFMFDNASAFNTPLPSWDVRNVTDMTNMFHFSGFQDIEWLKGVWDMSNVKKKENMFVDPRPIWERLKLNQSQPSNSVQL